MLMSCTTWRWLNNEKTRGFNRIFCLGLSNGEEVIARMPFRNAGSRHLTTRSEVATMDFLRSRLGALVPKVLAWEASPNNAVGCEYIIMEKCPGDALAVHERISSSSLAHMAEIYAKLAKVTFSQYGSIYYKEDVSPDLQTRPLYSEGFPEDDCAKKFRIGSSVDRIFYRGERSSMNIDHGPWPNINPYIRAVTICEIDWIRQHSNLPQAQLQPGARHKPEQHISLLERWLCLSSAVLPTESQLNAPVLSHPDLHAANLFVRSPTPAAIPGSTECTGVADTAKSKPPSSDITGIIDWQGATVRPLFETVVPQFLEVTPNNLTFVKLPGAFEPPAVLVNADKLSVREQATIKRELALVDVMQQPTTTYFASHSWSDGLPNLERVLINLHAAYGKGIPAHPNYPECPVTFSTEDQKRCDQEFDQIVGIEEKIENALQITLMEKGIDLHPVGAVFAEDFEEAQKEVARFLADLLEDANSHQADVIRRLWPTREGRFVHGAESCVD
ncbi:hypothetical protein BOTBODRAFT_64281 [Botryobasidium botryosum FD-172 SS1]|uniref:Aminoglycoside phosphotransferase domain-containing protein n=1 Tax=Botryobasidium botryosum (strain FD-172 SS1) TaxID=930990 RepID=A0A067MNC7_BOTB1|nr:hypothetical protein BOTBODRAFT_64281 [Botryobasidium botryosum FD-172 SS1]